jgi:hypothetical protein
VIVFLRNLDAKRVLAIPFANGWARLLAPGVTSAVPRAVLAQPAVRTLLVRQFIARVDSGGWDADERQKRALAADMARAIAAAEQAEVAKMVKPIRLKPRRAPTGRPRHSWRSGERAAQFAALWNAGATAGEIADAMAMSRESVYTLASQLGLPRRTARGQERATGPRRAPVDTETPALADAA